MVSSPSLVDSQAAGAPPPSLYLQPLPACRRAPRVALHQARSWLRNRGRWDVQERAEGEKKTYTNPGQFWVESQILRLIDCVTLSKFLHLSGSQFLHLSQGRAADVTGFSREWRMGSMP